VLALTSSGAAFSIGQVLAGVSTTLQTTTLGTVTAVDYQLRILAFTTGLVIAQATPIAGDGTGNWVTYGTPVTLSALSTAVATGGALASGKPGIRDFGTTGSATRYYDNFTSGTPSPADAVAYPSQSIELRSDRVRREDASGTAWGNLDGRYQGNYLKVPPAGQEARTCEFIVKLSRGDPSSMADPAIDDLSARLTIIPRYLNIPET